ncbi:MAG TPA: hypothetical protein VF605_13700 [Allosphingosinicella sp.]
MNNGESQGPKLLRGALYVDGFNLYHPIDQAGEPHLKWLDLWKLGQVLCAAEGLDLVKVVFCTAVPKHMPDKRDRHNLYNAAQRAGRVTVLLGHHVPGDDGTYSEKQSDINVALSVILDGLDDVYDVAFLLSADSDQVATARFFKERLSASGKKLIGAIPLGRTFPTDYAGLGVAVVIVTKEHLEACVMPAQVQGAKNLINRPQSYDPPPGWVHPADRPQGKPPKAPKKGAWGKPVKSSH